MLEPKPAGGHASPSPLAPTVVADADVLIARLGNLSDTLRKLCGVSEVCGAAHSARIEKFKEVVLVEMDAVCAELAARRAAAAPA